jgi:polyisoprenoid-binding protein YceI
VNIKMGLNKQIKSTGSLGLFDITDDLTIRIAIEGAGVENSIAVRGRIKFRATTTSV